MKIQTTGLDQYAPGGSAKVKTMVIGGPGAGKTRWSSFFPKPIYADCEGGLASVADRSVPYVAINDSHDMLDLLDFLKKESKKAEGDRDYETVVIDTLDAFQRKVKDEWLRDNPTASSFSGYDAWGYLDAKMQMLMTRLLNLPMNVVVLVHYSDKTYQEKENDRTIERHEFILQLQGSMKDQAFNDFDLVGWMGTFWEVEDGERQQKRGLTFQPTPDKPFLKDRLHVTPKFLEVRFEEADYTRLFEAITSKIDDLPTSTVVGEIERKVPGDVVGPDEVGGPVEGRSEAKPDLGDLTKKQLMDRAKELGLQIPGNALKAEVLREVEQAEAAALAANEEAEEPSLEQPEEPAAETAEAWGTFKSALSDAERETTLRMWAERFGDKTVADLDSETLGNFILEVDAVLEAAANAGDELQEQLDATEVQTPVEEEAPEEEAEAPEQEDAPAASDDGVRCADCGADVATDNFRPLAEIKFKVPLCETDYRKRKAAA